MINDRTEDYERRARNGRKRRRRSGFFRKLILFIILAAAVAGAWQLLDHIMPGRVVNHMGEMAVPEWVDSQIINHGGSSRSGVKLKAVNNIVVHYVGNPSTSAQANRDYYENPASSVSSHYVVGLQGEIIQCIPLDERSAASNNRNADTISIEVCHPDDSGVFNDSTYWSLVNLTAWLCSEAGLDADDVIRHYDVTGKECPRWFVRDEAAWLQFKENVRIAIKNF